MHDILQDDHGFLWISTDDGLNRYDGYQFKIFKQDPSHANSISNSTITPMANDHTGHLWVGTWGGGLNQFNSVNQQFTAFQHVPEQNDSISGNRIQCLYIDGEGTLWIGTYSSGLNRYDKTTRSFHSYRAGTDPAKSLPHDRVWCITEAEPGFLWIGTENGLCLLDVKRQTFRRYTHHPEDQNSLSHNAVYCMWKTDRDQLWLGTRKGLNRLSAVGGKFTHFEQQPSLNYSLDKAEIVTLFEDHLKRVWIGVRDNGVVLFDPNTQKFKALEHRFSDLRLLRNLNIKSMYEDRTNILWMGTDIGLVKVDLKPPKFRHFKHSEIRPDKPVNNKISVIYEDHKQDLIIATFGGGLHRFDRKTQRFFSSDNGFMQDYDHIEIRSILEDDQGQLWLGTYTHGLHKWDSAGLQKQVFLKDPDDPTSLSHNRIRVLFSDRLNRLWVGTERGPNLKVPNKPGFTNALNHSFFKNFIGDNRVYHITQAHDGHIWIGTQAGVRVVNEELGPSRHFYDSAGSSGRLSNNWVFCLLEDFDHNMWLGTNAGLNRYHSESGRLDQFFIKDGLPGNSISGLLEDGQGNLWISTKSGLAQFISGTEVFRSFDIYDGLQDNSFNRGVFFKSKTGELYFGGNNGFNSFMPQEVMENPHPPPIILTNLELINTTPFTHIPILTKKRIRLDHNQNMFTLTFAALDFTNPEKNRYIHRLEGLEKDWSPESTDHKVTYTNLDPGSYRLQVRGSNNDSVWEHAGAALNIVVVPPFWSTWWAKLLYVVTAATMAIGFPLFRIRSLKIREEALARAVAEKTGELRNKNELLAKKNQEMLTLDRIVQTMNREVKQDKLLYVLLQQGINLFPDAEKGAFLLPEPPDNHFRFKAVSGYPMEEVAHVRFTVEEALGRYATGKTEIEEGVFLIRDISALPAHPGLSRLPTSKAMLAMSVTIKGPIEGFLIFENHSSTQAFNYSDVENLKRFREHAVTALEKAKLIKELTETASHLKATQQLLMDTAHQAGMAEIATNVLHNVGNTLNSANTSLAMITELGHSPAIHLFDKIVQLVETHNHELNEFLTHDPQGKQVPAALLGVSKSMQVNNKDLRVEIAQLRTHLDYLKNVIDAQRDFAQSEGIIQQIELHHCLEEVLTIERFRLESNRVTIIRRFRQLPPIMVQKSKLIRVLINLINNACEAFPEDSTVRNLQISCGRQDAERIFVEFQDNGRGIGNGNIKRIFNQGFTTKTQGGGVGLHYAANIIKEMGGTIKVVSRGEGEGAVFTVYLPLPRRSAKKGAAEPGSAETARSR